MICMLDGDYPGLPEATRGLGTARHWSHPNEELEVMQCMQSSGGATTAHRRIVGKCFSVDMAWALLACFTHRHQVRTCGGRELRVTEPITSETL